MSLYCDNLKPRPLDKDFLTQSFIKPTDVNLTPYKTRSGLFYASNCNEWGMKLMGNRGRKDREGTKMRSYETVEPEYGSIYATTLVYLVRNTGNNSSQTTDCEATNDTCLRQGRSLSLSIYIYISHAPKSKRVIRQGFTTVNSGRRTAWQGSAVATDIWLLWPAVWLSDVSVNQSDALELMRSKTKELYLWIPRGNDEVISVFRRKHVWAGSLE